MKKKTAKQTVRAKAPEGFHFHKNGGGLVADTAHVAKKAFVGPEARVLDSAWVMDQARVTGKSVLSQHTFVGGDAVIDGQELNHGIFMGTWA